MKFSKGWVVALAAVALAAYAAPAARADTGTFASFQEVDTATNSDQLDFNNNGRGGSHAQGELTNGPANGVAIDFRYVTGGIIGSLPPSLTGDIAAHMFVNLKTGGSAMNAAGFGIQPLMTGTVSIIRDSDHKNLLTAKFDSSLSGALGGTTAGESASTSAGNTITFSSDFIHFPSPADNGVSWSMTSVDPKLAIAGNGLLRSFTSFVTGSFSSVPTPEPGTLALAFSALPVLGLVALRRRRNRV